MHHSMTRPLVLYSKTFKVLILIKFNIDVIAG